MNEADRVSVREHIERILLENNLRRDDLRREDRRWAEQIISSLKERFDSSVAEVDKARQHQAKEYERRLQDLNHAHTEAQRVLHTYVTRAVYEKDHEALRLFQGRVEVEMAERFGKSKGLALVIGVIYSTVVVTITAAGVFFNFIRG